MDPISSPACQVPHTDNELSRFLRISSAYNDDYDLTVRMPILVRGFFLIVRFNLSADREVSDDFFQCTARTLI